MSTFTSLVLVLVSSSLVLGCLITNCPRGGKRSKLIMGESTVKPCISCGPGHSGQCFGPNICCGPFGCLMGTPETFRCQTEGLFHEREPCIAGSATCRKNTGRCAFDGVCCSQNACFADRTCSSDEKPRGFPDNPPDLYSLINYQAELSSDN